MKKFNVALPKKYTPKGGEEKTFWASCGTITEFDDGKMMMELNMFEGKYMIFPIEEEKKQTTETKQPEMTLKDFEEEIKVDDILF